MKKEEKTEGIHSGHRDRMKKRFLADGVEVFEDHQILEMLLFYSVPRRDTNELAHKLIAEFGSLAGVFDASADELIKINGVGENTAALIKLIPQIYSRYLLSRLNAPELTLTSGASAGEYFKALLMHKQTETLVAAFLDVNLVLKKTAVISKGDITSTQLNLSRLVSIAVNCGAVNIIIGHNHPSGLAVPSRGDVEAVSETAKTLEKLGVKLCDSIIVAGDEYFSMAQSKKFKYLF